MNMKVLGTYQLDKYATPDFNQIAYEIYHNRAKNNYCFCFEAAEEVEQYPLEDLLDQYLVNCTEWHGQGVEINGKTRYLIEVETLDAGKDNFIKLLNFSTILNKTIVNYVQLDGVCLGEQRAVSSFSIRGEKITVPIIANRNDQSGMMSFNLKYPEAQLAALFVDNRHYDLDRLDGEFAYIELKDRRAYLVLNQGDDVQYQYVFNTRGFERYGVD